MEELLKYIGWVFGLGGTGLAALTAFRKARVDESGQAIQAWKEITDRHETEIENLKKELQERGAETFMLRRKLREVEDDCYEERIEFRRTIEGMQRQILQLHTSYLAQMTILADPNNPDHARILERTETLLDQVAKALEG